MELARNSEDERDQFFTNRGLEEEFQQKIGCVSTATHHIDKTKIKRRFHNSKYQRIFF